MAAAERRPSLPRGIRCPGAGSGPTVFRRHADAGAGTGFAELLLFAFGANCLINNGYQHDQERKASQQPDQ